MSNGLNFPIMGFCKYDWIPMQALYIAGLTLAEISRKNNVPYKTVARASQKYGWPALRERTRQEVGIASQQQPTEAIVRTLAQRRSEWIERVAGQTEQLAEGLEHAQRKAPAKSRKVVAEHAAALEAVDRIARRTLGLDSAGASSTVQVSILGVLREQDQLPEPKPVQAIDIQSDVK